jgi:hypothetical protein
LKTTTTNKDRNAGLCWLGQQKEKYCWSVEWESTIHNLKTATVLRLMAEDY